MKHSYFSNDFIICLQSIFSVVEITIELLLFANNYLCLCILFVKSNFVYVLVHRNILMYDILACHLFV